MLIIRETFITKPGQASKMAKLMKELMGEIKGVRILTDYIAEFNTVAIETEIEDLSEYDKRMQDYAKDEKWREKMSGYTEMYLTGKREIFRVW